MREMKRWEKKRRPVPIPIKSGESGDRTENLNFVTEGLIFRTVEEGAAAMNLTIQIPDELNRDMVADPGRRSMP